MGLPVLVPPQPKRENYMIEHLWIAYLSWTLIIAVLLMLALVLLGPKRKD